MSPDSSKQVAYEKEITLLICSERSEELEKDLSSLSEVGGYHLSSGSYETIDDTYFDTADEALGARRYALRIRRTPAGHWITLKGPSSLTEWGGLERSEMEALWSEEALEKALREIDRLGVYPLRSANFDPIHPFETMKSLGFKIVQNRRLRRLCKAVTDRRAGPEIAELAIDDVTYRFASREILHSEVEIEAKTAKGPSAVKELAEALMERYGPTLRRWPYGKLATGRAIEQLLLSGDLNDLMNGRRLMPTAYTVIAKLLSQRAPKKKAP